MVSCSGNFGAAFQCIAALILPHSVLSFHDNVLQAGWIKSFLLRLELELLNMLNFKPVTKCTFPCCLKSGAEAPFQRRIHQCGGVSIRVDTGCFRFIAVVFQFRVCVRDEFSQFISDCCFFSPLEFSINYYSSRNRYNIRLVPSRSFLGCTSPGGGLSQRQGSSTIWLGL